MDFGEPDRSPSFADLMRAAKAGSREDLGLLLEQFRQYLRLVANKRHSNGGEGTSDLVQETFLRAQTKLDGFDGTTEEEFKGWLRQILVNILVDWHRYTVAEKRDATKEVSLDTVTDWNTKEIRSACSSDPTPSSCMIAEEQRNLMSMALSRLPAHYARVLHLRHKQDLPFEVVARRLGRSEQATRQLWVRAVERLNVEVVRVSSRK